MFWYVILMLFPPLYLMFGLLFGSEQARLVLALHPWCPETHPCPQVPSQRSHGRPTTTAGITRTSQSTGDGWRGCAVGLQPAYVGLRHGTLSHLPGDGGRDDAVVVLSGLGLLRAGVGGDEGEALIHELR